MWSQLPNRVRRLLPSAGVVLVSLLFLAVALEPPEVRGGDARSAYLNARAAAVGATVPFLPVSHHTARWAVTLPLRAVVALDPDEPVLFHLAPALAFVLAAWATFAAARRVAGVPAGWIAVGTLFSLPTAARAASQPLPDGISAAAIAVALALAGRFVERPSPRGAVALAASLAVAYGARLSSLLFVPSFAWFIGRRSGLRALVAFACVLAAVVVVDNAGTASILGATRLGLVRAGHGTVMERFALPGLGAYLGRMADWPAGWLCALFLATVAFVAVRRDEPARALAGLAFGTASVYVFVLTYGLSDLADLVPVSRLRPRYLFAAGPALAIVVGVGATQGLRAMWPRRLRWHERGVAGAGAAFVALVLVAVAVSARGSVPRGIAALRATADLDRRIDGYVVQGLRFTGRGRRGRQALKAVADVFVDMEHLRRGNEILRRRIERWPGTRDFWIYHVGGGPTGGPLRCPVPVGLEGRFLTVGEPAEDDFTCFPLAPRPRRSAPRPLRGRPPPPQRHGR